jgi:hypothetical protein
MSLYHEIVPPILKTLAALETWLNKTEQFAKTKSFDPNTLLTARLAPDQFALLRQLQAVCDQAKFIPARASGKIDQAPKHPDVETTLDEIRTRLASVRTYLEGFSPADFEGRESAMVPLPFLPIPGKGLLGGEYVRQYALPNFYFHVSMTYAILRHNGVDLGKRDYLGQVPFRDV